METLLRPRLLAGAREDAVIGISSIFAAAVPG